MSSKLKKYEEEMKRDEERKVFIEKIWKLAGEEGFSLDDMGRISELLERRVEYAEYNLKKNTNCNDLHTYSSGNAERILDEINAKS